MISDQYFHIFRFDLDFWEWVEEIDWYSYWNAMYVVMIAMILHAVNSMLSAYATYSQSRALLITSVILRFVHNKMASWNSFIGRDECFQHGQIRMMWHSAKKSKFKLFIGLASLLAGVGSVRTANNQCLINGMSIQAKPMPLGCTALCRPMRWLVSQSKLSTAQLRPHPYWASMMQAPHMSILMWLWLYSG